MIIMRKFWKNPRVLGKLAYWAMKLLTATIKITVINRELVEPKEPYLFAFWHGEQFLPSQIIINQHKTPMCVMVSPSRDGAILTTYLEKIGYEIIRGSSRDGNVRVLIGMKSKLAQGYSLGFGIDGPIGPIYVVKPGMIFLAQKCNVKIVPVGSAFSKYWTFNKAWDKFKLPKPFAKAVLVYGEPFSVDPEADVNQMCVELENKIKLAEQRAYDLLK